MKKIGIVTMVVLVVLAAGWVWMSDSQARDDAHEHGEKELYTCGMHPEIVSTEPGVCPICNMNLTPKRDTGEGSETIRIDATTRQNMGLVTSPVTPRSLSKSVRAFGRVEVAEPNYYSVTLKVPGWIEELYVREQGARVFKGQPLLSIYSPDLVAAQREYLAVAGNGGGSEKMGDLLKVAESRLRNWDVPEDQLDRLRESGEVSRTMLIRAPADGFVTRKTVNAGDQIRPGSILYEIADLSTVWVTAFVYEQDLPFLKVGQKGAVTTQANPGREYDSRVIFVSPTLNPGGQVEIRLEMDNTDLSLRPEMYAGVTLEHRARGNRLSIPRSAVINTGARQVVYVATSDDAFQPRTITTGATDANDLVEVLSGLTAGEMVVVSGQFMLDSESRLSEAIGASSGHQHHGGMSAEMPDSAAMEDEHESHAATGKTEDPYDIHTCPMPSHYHVLNYGPGMCEECGMALVPVGETDNKDIFVCPMPECETARHEPGQCPKCNMNLMKYEPESDDAI